MSSSDASVEPVFEEVQEAPWPLTVLGVGGSMVGGLAAARALGLGARLGVAGLIAAGAGVALSQFLIPMRTLLFPDEIQVLFGKKTRFRIPLRHVTHAWARVYSPVWEFGGWGIRNGPQGRALNLSGNEGVQLVLRSGRRLLIGSQRSAELATGIRRLSGCEGEPRAREPEI